MCTLHSRFFRRKKHHFFRNTHSLRQRVIFFACERLGFISSSFLSTEKTPLETPLFDEKNGSCTCGETAQVSPHRTLLLNTSIFESEIFYSMRKPLCFRIDRALSEISLYCWNTSLKKFVLPMMLIAFSLLRTTHPLEYSLSTDSIHSKRSSLIGEDSTLLKKDFKSSGFSRKKISPTDSIERSGKHILRRSSSIA